MHDRVKTFQPRDLWEWLLRIAVVLFVFDIAVRRVMIDREEWAAGWRRARVWIPFLKPAAPAPASDPSLASLLARRHEVRAQQPAAPPATAPAHLFTPRTEPIPAESQPVQPAAAAPAEDTSVPAPPGSMASRLLEAKRRAQKRKE